MTISAAFANTWRDEKGRFADKGYVAADGGIVDIDDLDGEIVEKSTIAELVEAYDLYENQYGPVKMSDGASLYALPGEYGEQVRYVALLEEEDGTSLEIYDDFYDVAHDIDIGDQESDVHDEFLRQAKRTIVFHGTRDQDSFDSIKEGGIGTRNETRAPGANDFVGSAVFTTSNENVAYEYGADTFVFEIDLPQAIADGVITTDHLSREPGINEAEVLSGIAYGYDDDSYNAYDGFSSAGIDEATIIISTDIPPKYLKPYGNAESLTVQGSVSLGNEWRDEIGRFAPKGYTAVSSGVLIADAETLLQARNKAQAMMSAAPQPPQTAVIAHQADALLAREGWIRAGGERRGNSTRRAERLQEMADLWGDGEVMPCVHTGVMLAGNKEAALKYGLEMAQQDKLIVGPHGGGYTIDNLVPSSRAANQSRGDDTPVWLGQPEWGDPAAYASVTSTANSREIALQFQKRRKAIRSRRRDKGKSVSAPKGKLWDTKWRGEEFEPAGPQPEVSGGGDGGGVDTDVVDKYGFVGGAVDGQGGDRSGDWGRVDDVGVVGGFGVSEGHDSLVGKRSVPSERFAGGGRSVGEVHGGHDSSLGVRRAVQFANTWRDEILGEQAVDFDDAEDAGRAEWWAKVVEGRMAGDQRPPSAFAIDGSVRLANTWRDEIGRFAPKGYQASKISGSDLAGMTIDGEHGRVTFEANGDGTYRLLYDIEQVSGGDKGADVEMNVAVELDENGDIVAIEAVLADQKGYRDFEDSDVEEVVRLLEKEFTGAGAELMAPDYRERPTLQPGLDEIDAQPIPDDGDFAAMLVHELYGFEHRGERYRFDIQSEAEGWVKFDIVDDYGATVAAVTRSIGDTSMQNERFFMADEFQNQGIGTKFLDGFEAAVHERFDISTIGLEAVSTGRYAWASRGFEKIGGFDSTAEDWLDGMRDHVSGDAGKLSKLDVIEDSWRHYGDGVYPGELIGVDRDAAHDVLLSGPSWHGEIYVGSNSYTNWEKEFLSRPEDVYVPQGQDRPEQIPGQGELFASLTIDSSVSLANDWRDERGRFAPKGYVPSISTLIDNWTVDHKGEPTREAWALKHYGAIAVAGTMDYEMEQSIKRNLEGKTLGDEDLRGFTAELTNSVGAYYGDSEAAKSMPLGLAMQLYAFDSYVRSSKDIRNTESVAGALDKFIADPTYENEQQVSFALEENYGITVESAAVNYVNRGWQQSSVGHIAGPTQIAWSFHNDRVNGVSMDGALASMNLYMPSGAVDTLNRTSRTLHGTLSAVAVSNQRYTRQVLDTHLDPDATISLHRAMKTSVSKDMTGVQSNPLSSWTTDFDMAHTNFSGFVGKGGGTMTADVPRQHIMSIATITGMGSQKESEVIVSGEAVHSVVGVEMKLMADDVVIFVDDPNVSGPDWIKQVDGVALTMSGGVELSLGGEVTDTHDDPYVDPVLANRMARLWTEAYATFANTMSIELAAKHAPLSSPLTASASSPMSWTAIVDEMLADGLGDAFYDALVGVNVEIGFDIRDAVVEQALAAIIEHVRAFEPSIRKSTTKWLQKSLRDGLSVDAAVAALPTDSPLSPRQAYLTARTELIAASNNGAYLGYLEAGVKSKTWITARDDRVRKPTHTDMEGKKVDLRTDFLVGDGFPASYPGDPRLPIKERIQCRCTIVPSFEPNGKKAITKKELYAQAVKREIPGRSRMNKPQLQQALAADVTLDLATMAQLHIISRARNIVGRYRMRKAELLAAIRAS